VAGGCSYESGNRKVPNEAEVLVASEGRIKKIGESDLRQPVDEMATGDQGTNQTVKGSDAKR
jgi:hypothetical protein